MRFAASAVLSSSAAGPAAALRRRCRHWSARRRSAPGTEQAVATEQAAEVGLEPLQHTPPGSKLTHSSAHRCKGIFS